MTCKDTHAHTHTYTHTHAHTQDTHTHTHTHAHTGHTSTKDKTVVLCRTFENLLRMRPTGFVSKKRIGEAMTAANMVLCSFCEAWRKPTCIKSARAIEATAKAASSPA